VSQIVIDNTNVVSEQVRGVLTGKLTVALGGRQEVGVYGHVALDRGDVDLFGRRYTVDHAEVAFDGSLDPMLDIRITRDFPEVTTITEIKGRLSKPDLDMRSEPATYSQAELLGFLLGGEPNAAPNTASAAEKVAQSGTSVVANTIGGYVRKALPFDIDVIRYESATATSSAAVTVGKWITHELFLAFRQRLETRPDQNTVEGSIEWWFRRSLMLEAVIGDRGVDGLDLLWRRRW
jgi:translocation and assembly module TamB